MVEVNDSPLDEADAKLNIPHFSENEINKIEEEEIEDLDKSEKFNEPDLK